MSDAQTKLQNVLQIWMTVMSNVRMRDRSVKILQYGSQMLIGFWGAALSRHAKEGLSLLQRSSSTSRKAFWVLKSISNIGIAMKQVEDGYFNLESTLVQKLDAIENIFLMWYYWCETKVFFARSRMFDLQEKAIDYSMNLSWALGDTAGFFAAAIRLRNHLGRCADVKNELSQARPGVDVSEQRERLQYELVNLQSCTGRLQSNVAIGVMELAVSAEYAGLFRFLTGKRLSGTYIGAFGVCSSALTLYNGIMDAVIPTSVSEIRIAATSTATTPLPSNNSFEKR